jgi:hypothetical protein
MEVFTKELDGGGASLGPARPVVLDDGWCEALPTDHRHVVFGDGADKAAELWSRHARCLPVPGVHPSVYGLAMAAYLAFQRKDFADLAYLVPDYGKEANVTQPTKRAAQ